MTRLSEKGNLCQVHDCTARALICQQQMHVSKLTTLKEANLHDQSFVLLMTAMKKLLQNPTRLYKVTKMPLA